MPTDRITVYSYSALDEKMYRFSFRENQLQLLAEQFTTEIFFLMSEEDATEYGDIESPQDNLKEDFIYFTPKLNATSYWTCTCGNFLETDQKGADRMVKRTIAHARKQGHTIYPRGN